MTHRGLDALMAREVLGCDVSSVSSGAAKAVLELQGQVGELLRFKEEAFKAKAEVSMLKGEGEAVRRKVQMLLDEGDEAHGRLCERNAKVERENENLKALVGALKADAARQVEGYGKLQKQVITLQRKAQMKSARVAILEDELKSLKAEFTSVETVHRQNSTQVDGLAAEFASKVKVLSTDVESKKATITSLRNELASLTTHSSKQAAVIGELNSSVTGLTERVEHLLTQTDQLPNLRHASTTLIQTQSELDATQAALHRVTTSFEREKNDRIEAETHLRRLESENIKLKESTLINEDAHRITERTRAELRCKTIELENSLEREAHLKHHLQTIESEITQQTQSTIQQRNEITHCVTGYLQELTVELNAVLRGDGGVVMEGVGQLAALKSTGVVCVVEAAAEMRRRTSTICHEVQKLRKQLELVITASEAQEKHVQQLQADHVTVVREHQRMVSEVENYTRELRDVKDAGSLSEARLEEQRTSWRTLQEKMKRQHLALEKLVRGSKLFEKINIGDTPLAFETVLFMLGDTLSGAAQCVGKNEVKITTLQTTVDTMQQELDATRRTLQDVQDNSKKILRETGATHDEVLSELRAHYEISAEREKIESKKSNTKWCKTIQTLSRYLYEVANRLHHVMSQRKALGRYCRELDRAVSIYEFCGGKRRPNLRTAALSIIAANRLRGKVGVPGVALSYYLPLWKLKLIEVEEVNNLPYPESDRADEIARLVNTVVGRGWGVEEKEGSGFGAPVLDGPVKLAERTLHKHNNEIRTRDELMLNIEDRVREISHQVTTKTPPRNVSPRRTHTHHLDVTPPDPILAFISQLDQRVEDTLRRSRAVTPLSNNTMSTDVSLLLNPIIHTEPPCDE